MRKKISRPKSLVVISRVKKDPQGMVYQLVSNMCGPHLLTDNGTARRVKQNAMEFWGKVLPSIGKWQKLPDNVVLYCVFGRASLIHSI